ncbi:type II secretion system F family protein [bacterium]|nr:type II secretion system F family protein [bacterium]
MQVKIVFFKGLILSGVFLGTVWSVFKIVSFFDSFRNLTISEKKDKEKRLYEKKWFINILLKKPKAKFAWVIEFFSLVMGISVGYLFFGRLLWGFVLGGVSFFIPSLWAKREFGLFMDKFNQQLINGLVLIANSLRAGMSFLQGMEIMVKESGMPLSGCFERVLQEINLGMSPQEALNGLVERMPNKELKIIVAAINITRQTGGNLSEILDNLSFTMRERKKIQGKINALTAQGKMSGWIVGIMPFILMFILNLMSPEMMWPLFHTLPGYVTIFVICFMVGIAALIIKNIVSIDI